MRTFDYQDGEFVLKVTARDRDRAASVPGLRFHKPSETWRGKPYLSVALAVRGVFGDDLEVSDAAYDAVQEELAEHQLVAKIKEGGATLAYPGLRDEQSQAVECALLRKGFLIGDEKGYGKTIEALAATRAFPALVVCTNTMKYTWEAEAHKWLPERSVAVLGRTPTQRRMALESGAEIIICSWDQVKIHSRLAAYGSVARTEAEKEDKELNLLGFRTVIADECVPDTTLIETRKGRVPISDVSAGDEVLGVDHTTGETVWSVVLRTMTSPDRDLVRIGDLWITPEHPVWVDASTLCYATLYAEDYKDRQDMRVVRNPIPDNAGRWSLLLQEMFEQKSSYSRVSGAVSSKDDRSTIKTRSAGEVAKTPARPNQPVPRPKNTGEGTQSSAGDGVSNVEWRKWHGTYHSAESFIRESWRRMGIGARHSDKWTTELPPVLQGGHCTPWFEDSDRSQWEQSSGERPKESGPEESSHIVQPRLVCDPSNQPGRNGRPLWNLETTTGNYVANGVLVHNCHRAKNPKAKQTRALWAVGDDAEYRYALTATPVAGHTMDLWGILRFIRPDEFPSRSKFIDRFVATYENPWGGIEDMGLNPVTEDEFRRIFEPNYIRRPLNISAQLLPPQYRFVDMEGKQRTVYNKIAKESVADIDGKFLLAIGPLTVNTRLQQLAQGTPVLDDDGNVTELSLPSCKYDALCDLLDEMGDEPLVVYAESRKLIELCQRELIRSKRFTEDQIGMVTGQVPDAVRTRWVERFQAGELPVILCTIGAGSEGITLTRAHTMVFLNRSYRFVGNNQAEGRLYRHGQERDVQIIDVIARDSEEMRVHEAFANKDARLQSLVMDEDWTERERPADSI